MLELVFITSNIQKLAHAKYLCCDYPVKIIKQKNYGIGYIEPRIDDREELIKRSVDDATARFKKYNSNEEQLFFIEDTSVIITGLSGEKEYPGVDVKYWMKENSFRDVDIMLKGNGNNREVIVRSDVILVLNKELKRKFEKNYVVFTSLKKGTIAEREVRIKTQPLYPWLNNSTFNKWFVPAGASGPLSSLPIETANQFDFRAKAFKDMMAFLKKNGYLKSDVLTKQLELFEPVAFIICGPSCAGKTSLSSFLQSKYNYYHLEASDFMYLSYYERHGVNSNVPIGDFAEQALKDNPSIVVDQIISHIQGFKHIPIVVTGFRSPTEVEHFKVKYGGELNVEVIFIEADEKLRFERNIMRNRADAVKTFKKFKSKDAQQFNMGLLEIKKSNVQGILANESTIETMNNNFALKYQNQLQGGLANYAKKLPSQVRRKNLQNVIIKTLYDNTLKSFTTTEISYLIKKNETHLPKNKNNISRYFNQNFYPYFEIENKDGKINYRLSQTGMSYGKWINIQDPEDSEDESLDGGINELS